jgi:hypothetical protein
VKKVGHVAVEQWQLSEQLLKSSFDHLDWPNVTAGVGDEYFIGELITRVRR